MYYTHPSCRTSILGENRAYCIRDFTVTNVSLMDADMLNWINSYFFRKSRRHQSVFVTSEYTSSTTTTTTTSRHLLQTHRCTKERGEFTLLG